MVDPEGSVAVSGSSWFVDEIGEEFSKKVYSAALALGAERQEDWWEHDDWRVGLGLYYVAEGNPSEG